MDYLDETNDASKEDEDKDEEDLEEMDEEYIIYIFI